MKRLSLIAALFSATSVYAQDTTMIVLDASGSMWGQIDGINKIVIARDVVRENFGTAAQGQTVGLLAYGHRRKGDCGDIEVLVAPGAGQSGAVVAAVEAINPKGKTPLTEAVRQAATAMKHQENKSTVVLVTDGLETCGADPCALARELEQTGVDFTAHVVGFGLSKKDGEAVACLANETGGRYFEADNKGELAAALSLTVAQDIKAETVIEEPPQVEPKHNLQINVQLSADSPPLEVGQIDKLALDLIRQSDGTSKRVSYDPVLAMKAEPGDYVVRASFAGGQADLPVTIEQFDVTHATVSLEAGVVDFRAIPLAPDLIDPAVISWRVINAETGKQENRFVPELRSVLAAGSYDVTVVLGRKDRSSPPPVRVDVAPGDVTEGEILLPHGAVALEMVSNSGARLPDSHTRFALWSVKPDGSADKFVVGLNDTRFPLLALPGDYVLIASDWGIAGGGKRTYEEALTLAPGASVARRIVMPADAGQPMVLAAQ